MIIVRTIISNTEIVIDCQKLSLHFYGDNTLINVRTILSSTEIIIGCQKLSLNFCGVNTLINVRTIISSTEIVIGCQELSLRFGGVECGKRYGKLLAVLKQLLIIFATFLLRKWR